MDKGGYERITIGKNCHQLATPRNRKDEERVSHTYAPQPDRRSLYTAAAFLLLLLLLTAAGLSRDKRTFWSRLVATGGA